MLIVTPDKLAILAKAVGRADLLTDPRFSDPAKLMQNMPQLTAILDEVFGSQPMAHWYEVFNGVHVTFGAVRGPQEVVDDPQLRANDIVVPLEGAGGKLTSTISSPIQVHGVAKVPAKRAPALGEHNEEILEQLGFSATEIEGFLASRTIPGVKHPPLTLPSPPGGEGFSNDPSPLGGEGRVRGVSDCMDRAQYASPFGRVSVRGRSLC